MVSSYFKAASNPGPSFGRAALLAAFDADALARAVLGDSIYTNPIMLGFAWQKGWIPLQRASLVRAIELNGVAEFLLLFVGLEFFYYWYHRTAHRVRFFWATHSVHHSPNQLTLSTAFRLGWTGKLTGTGLFFTPLALLGFDPKVVLTALSLNLLYQFWLHTTWIPKLGWLEYVLNTPSAHRVHHASNLDYLDANYGGVLIVFDRIFGTYVAEREAEPCVYGLVKPMRTRNLLTMEFSQWKDLWLDLRAARSLAQAMAFVLKPPGWSPDGKGETTEDMRGARALPAGSSTSGFVRSGS